jgi:hypothetical protein
MALDIPHIILVALISCYTSFAAAIGVKLWRERSSR